MDDLTSGNEDILHMETLTQYIRLKFRILLINNFITILIPLHSEVQDSHLFSSLLTLQIIFLIKQVFIWSIKCDDLFCPTNS